MRRRAFLRAAMAGAAAASLLPGWLRGAFADVSVVVDKPPPGKALLDALERARRLGRPLLVVIVPAAEERWDRGAAWGELLNHGSDEQLAPLALVEVACASLEEVRQVAPITETRAPASGSPGAPLLVVFDGATVRQVDRDVPSLRGGIRTVAELEQDKLASEPYEEAFPRRRIALLTEAIRSGLAPDETAARRWAATARARLTDDEISALDSGRWGDVPLVDRGAALVWLVALTDRARRAPSLRALARVVAARLRDLPPPGSRWGHASGCGTTYEQTPDEIAAEKAERAAVRDGRFVIVTASCGMGSVPAKSERFLDFLTREKREGRN